MATDERLAAWVDKKRGDMSFARFSEVSGVSKSSLQRLASGESDLSMENKLALARAFPDFPKWALPTEYASRSAVRTEPSPHRVEEERAVYRSSARVSRDQEFVSLPLYGIVASAGAGRWNDVERVETELMFRRDWLMGVCGTTKGLALITAEGGSMERTIKDGAVVMVRDLQSYQIGEGIYFVRVGGLYMIKRVKPLEFVPENDGNGTLALRALIISDADQTVYPPREVVFTQADEADNCIIARAVWTGSKLE